MEKLQKGDRGATVRYLQDMLNRTGAALDIDGIFGPLTESAVRVFQEAIGLPVSGVVDDQVWCHLRYARPRLSGSPSLVAPVVVEMLIPEGSPNRRCLLFEPEWITVHNTGNPRSTARDEASWAARRPDGASFHYAIDEREIVAILPESEMGRHCSQTGDAVSLGVEICEGGDWVQTRQNAVAFLAGLLVGRRWSVARVTTHHRWTGKVCPRLLLPAWNAFIADIAATIVTLQPAADVLSRFRLENDELRRDIRALTARIEAALQALKGG